MNSTISTQDLALGLPFAGRTDIIDEARHCVVSPRCDGADPRASAGPPAGACSP
jgi:hypothetical protein